MEFIENNYVLIIVIGVIVLMTIIGYFADKMETKEKQPKVKKEKKKEKKNQIMEQVPEMEAQNVDGELPPEWDENYVAVDEEQEVMNIEGTGSTDEWNTLPTESDTGFEEPMESEISFEQPTDFVESSEVNVEENETVVPGSVATEENDDVEEGMFDFNTDGMFVDSNVNSEIPEVENVEIQNDEESEQDTIEEVIPEQIDELNNLEITLPDIQMLNDEENNANEDEDVWKF